MLWSYLNIFECIRPCCMRSFCQYISWVYDIKNLAFFRIVCLYIVIIEILYVNPVSIARKTCAMNANWIIKLSRIPFCAFIFSYGAIDIICFSNSFPFRDFFKIWIEQMCLFCFYFWAIKFCQSFGSFEKYKIRFKAEISLLELDPI